MLVLDPAADRRRAGTGRAHAARRRPVVRPVPVRVAGAAARRHVLVGRQRAAVHRHLDASAPRALAAASWFLIETPSDATVQATMTDKPLRYDQRPADATPVHTADLPDTPTRDRNIVAHAWIEAPAELLALGDDLPGRPEATYKRRIGDVVAVASRTGQRRRRSILGGRPQRPRPADDVPPVPRQQRRRRRPQRRPPPALPDLEGRPAGTRDILTPWTLLWGWCRRRCRLAHDTSSVRADGRAASRRCASSCAASRRGATRCRSSGCTCRSPSSSWSPSGGRHGPWCPRSC